MASWADDRFDQAMDEIISDTKALSLNDPIEAPVSWLTIWRLSLVASLEYQICCAHSVAPFPTAHERMVVRLAAVADARFAFLEWKNDRSRDVDMDMTEQESKWEFDVTMKESAGNRLNMLRDEGKELVQDLWPDFELALEVLNEASRVCEGMGVALEH